MACRIGKRWLVLLVGLGVTLLPISWTSALEVQLAGIRLDAPWADVFEVYGQPDAVALHQGRQAPADAAAAKPPMWALPVWSLLDKGKVQGFYRKAEIAVGFVFDLEGCVRAIAVAGDAAGTPAWRPHRYVKLGDTWRRVLYHYGLPDKLQQFGGAPAGPEADAAAARAPGELPIDADQIAVGDGLFTYSEDNNIAFATHNGKVVRIHIWEPAE